jgi:trigger factor
VKVAAQEIEHSQVVLDIEVEDERLERAVDQAYRRIVQRMNVPGFRKGKAPRALVERMVGREALVEDAVEHLVPEVVEAAVREQELAMVARPTLEVVSTTPLQVKATVPVQPKVELGDYKSLTIEAKPANIEDEQVDQVVTRLQETNATWEPVERAVEMGDRVAIDVSGKVGETVVVDSKDAEYIVDAERPQPAEGFAEALVGMSADETKTVTLKLPEDYREKDIAGSDAEFTFAVHWVKARILPPLDNDFAATLGMEFETVDALRGAIRDNLQSREDHERRVEHEELVLQAVVDQSTVDLPPQLTEEEADRLLQQTAQNLERQGIPLQSYLRFTQKSEEQFREELLTQAERNVRRTEVLNAVAQAEGIEISDDEITTELSQSSEDPAEVRRLVREATRRPEFKERIAAMMRRQHATRLLLETVGGVDFDALEAQAQAVVEDEDATALAIDYAVDEVAEEAEIEAVLAEVPATEEVPVVAEATAEVATPAAAPAAAEQPAPQAGSPSGPAPAPTGDASA